MSTTIDRTGSLVRAAFNQRNGKLLFGATAVGYLIVYLAAIRDIAIQPAVGGGASRVGLTVVADPVSQMFQQMGPFQFEAIALVSIGPVSYLFSPMNALIGVVLAALVAGNIAVSLYTWRRPSVCSTRTPAGVLAGVPAVISGSACCGPLLLVVLGIQASSSLLAAFRILLPLSAFLLVGSLVYLGWTADEATMHATAVD